MTRWFTRRIGEQELKRLERPLARGNERILHVGGVNKLYDIFNNCTYKKIRFVYVLPGPTALLARLLI